MDKHNIDAIASELQSNDVAVRRKTLKKLFETDAETALPYFVQSLSDSDKAIQDLAMQYLDRMPSRKTVQQLIPLLKATEPGTRNAAKEVLANISYTASDLIIDLLIHDNDDIRITACDILAVLGLDDAVEPLMQALSDDNSNVRSNAAVALGMIGDIRAIQPLIELFKDNEWVRFCAIEALGRIGLQEVFDAVMEAFEKAVEAKDDLIICAASEALGYLRSDKAAKLLLQSLPRVNVAIRETILASLIEICGNSFVTVLNEEEKKIVAGCLVDSLNSNNEEMREFAVSALGTLNISEAALPLIYLAKELDSSDPLIELIQQALITMQCPQQLVRFLDDDDEDFVAFIIDTLGRFDNPEVRQHLMNIFDNKTREIRRIIAQHFSTSCDKTMTDQLIARLNDYDGHVRAYIARACGTTGDERCIEALIGVLNDDYEDVREAACESLIKIGGAVVTEKLVSLVTDAANPIGLRILVAGALGQLCKGCHDCEPVIRALMMIFSEDNKELKKAAAKTLGQIPHEDHVRLLAALLNDTEPAIRQSVIEIWRMQGDPAAGRNLLERLAIEEDTWTQYHIIKALGALNVTQARAALLEKLNEDNDLLKIAAIEALGKIGSLEILKVLKPYAASANPDIRQAVENVIRNKMES